MKRYSINLTLMQWALIAVDLGQIQKQSESTQALSSLIRVMMDHSEDPDMALPFNVENTDA